MKFWSIEMCLLCKHWFKSEYRGLSDLIDDGVYCRDDFGYCLNSRVKNVFLESPVMSPFDAICGNWERRNKVGFLPRFLD